MILGIGHPRTGTGYVSDLLSKNGLDVGHEKIKKDGMISWLAASELYDYPWGDRVSKYQRENAKIFLVARSPISSIQSVMGENLISESVAWRRKVIKYYFNKDIYTDKVCQQDPLGIAVASIYYWYHLCFYQNPLFIFRVDKKDDYLLEDNFGINIINKENLYRNSRPDRHLETPFVVNDLYRLRKEWIFRLAEISEMLGYKEDAKKMIGFYG